MFYFIGDRTQKLLQSSVVREDHRIRATAPRLAKSLEAALFAKTKSTRDDDNHNDSEYLKERLKALVQTLENRRKRKAASISEEREKFLRKVLGPEKHKKVKRLVDEVKLARLQKAGESCAACRKLENGTMVCPVPVNRFPCAVKQLFFGVELLHAIEFKPPYTWAQNNWDELIQQCEQILRDYRTWREINYAKAEPDENTRQD